MELDFKSLHYWELGWDPAVKQFRLGELELAQLIKNLSNRILVRATEMEGCDWATIPVSPGEAAGRIVGLFADMLSNTFNLGIMKRAILKHLKKADEVWLRLDRFSKEQRTEITNFIESLPPEQAAKARSVVPGE